MQSSPHVLTDEQMLDLMELAGYELWVHRHPTTTKTLELVMKKGKSKETIEYISADTTPSEMRKMAFKWYLEKHGSQDAS